jgi:hypothetical protein
MVDLTFEAVVVVAAAIVTHHCLLVHNCLEDMHETISQSRLTEKLRYRLWVAFQREVSPGSLLAMG